MAQEQLAEVSSLEVSFAMSFDQTPVCRLFASGGHCRFGTNCRFLHSQPASISASGHAGQYQHGLNYDPNYQPQFVQESYYNNYYYQPQAAYNGNQRASGSVCQFFARNGYCGYGNQCRYSHDLGQGYLYVTQNGGNNLRSYTPRNSSRVCYNYKKGYCRYGESCRFVHDQPEGGESREEPGQSVDPGQTGDLGQSVDQGESEERPAVEGQEGERQGESEGQEGGGGEDGVGETAAAAEERERCGPQLQISKAELTPDRQKEIRSK